MREKVRHSHPKAEAVRADSPVMTDSAKRGTPRLTGKVARQPWQRSSPSITSAPREMAAARSRPPWQAGQARCSSSDGFTRPCLPPVLHPELQHQESPDRLAVVPPPLQMIPDQPPDGGGVQDPLPAQSRRRQKIEHHPLERSTQPLGHRYPEPLLRP